MLLQSAMEYLMTYGWAILIIAVVLGALFQLGIFNASTFTPKAPPGACHVFRPNGPGTTSFINTQGICNGELPQYVAKFTGALTSYVNAGTKTILEPSVFTLTLWERCIGCSSSSSYIALGLSGTSALPEMCVSCGTGGIGPLIYMGGSNYRYFQSTGASAIDGAWHFISFSVPGNALTSIASSSVYIDGAAATVYTTIDTAAQSAIAGPFYIGAGLNYGFPGTIANVQFYNTTLSANEITSLYQEGIGGAPIKLNNLVGWWPLNGDTKDYSGNNNNGAASSVTFTSSWESGYSAP